MANTEMFTLRTTKSKNVVDYDILLNVDLTEGLSQKEILHQAMKSLVIEFRRTKIDGVDLKTVDKLEDLTELIRSEYPEAEVRVHVDPKAEDKEFINIMKSLTSNGFSKQDILERLKEIGE